MNDSSVHARHYVSYYFHDTVVYNRSGAINGWLDGERIQTRLGEAAKGYKSWWNGPKTPSFFVYTPVDVLSKRTFLEFTLPGDLLLTEDIIEFSNDASPSQDVFMWLLLAQFTDDAYPGPGVPAWKSNFVLGDFKLAGAGGRATVRAPSQTIVLGVNDKSPKTPTPRMFVGP